MNTPNKLTLSRIIMVFPFIILMILAIYYNNEIQKYIMVSTGIVFALAMITDFIDGYLARKNNQITTFGKLFDPLADKFMTTSALIGLSVMGIIPFYITLLFILRDLLVDGSRNLAAKNNVNVAAGFLGKAKTMLMSIGILIIFLVDPFIDAQHDLINPSWEIWVLIFPILLSSILSTISGFKYFKAVTPYINTK